MAENKKVIISIVVDDKSAKPKLKGIGDETEKLGNKANKANKGFLGLGKTFGAIARGFVIVKSFQLLAKAITSTVKILADFELAMNKVKAITGATDKEFKKLEKSAKDLALGTMFTATQVAELQLAYAKLGFTTQEIVDATEATTKLATITGDDLANSADVVGSAIRGFGLDAVEASVVVDVMAKSFTSSALNLESFKQSMKTVAPIASAANISLEQTTAMLSVLADSQLRGTKAATGLKNLMSQLTDPTSDLAKELGYTVGNSEGLSIAFDDLSKRNIDLAKATGLTDQRSKAAFLTLLKGKDTVEELTSAYLDANGAAEDMANVIEESVSVKFQKFFSAVEGFALREGGALLVSIGRLLDEITEFINSTDPAVEIMNKAETAMKNFTGEVTLAEVPLSKVKDKIKELENENKNLAKTMEDNKPEGMDFVRLLELEAMALDKTKQMTQNQRWELEKLRAEHKNGQNGLENYTEAQFVAYQNSEDQTKVNEKLLEQLQKELKLRELKAKRDKDAADIEEIKRLEKSAKQSNQEILLQIKLNKERADSVRGWKEQERARLQARKENLKLLEGLQEEEGKKGEEFVLWKKTLQQKEVKEANQITEKGLEKRQEIVDHNNAQLKKGEKQLNDEIKKLQEERNQLIQDAVNVGFDLLNVQLENRLNALERANEEELRGFEKLQNDKAARFDIEMQHQLDSFVGTEQQKADFEKQKALEQLEFQQQQEAERDKLRQKQLAEENKIAKASFRANKINSLANIAIDTAKAVAGINANPIVNADITQALRTTLTQLVTGIGIAQGAVVASQRFQPKTFQDGGMIQGDSHANGGVPFTVAGQAGFEAEGGEYIFSRKTVNRLGVDFLDSLNFNGGNPAPSMMFANGGAVPRTSQAGLNQAELADMIGEAVAMRISEIPVVNVATETAQISRGILNAEAMATL